MKYLFKIFFKSCFIASFFMIDLYSHGNSNKDSRVGVFPKEKEFDLSKKSMKENINNINIALGDLSYFMRKEKTTTKKNTNKPAVPTVTLTNPSVQDIRMDPFSHITSNTNMADFDISEWDKRDSLLEEITNNEKYEKGTNEFNEFKGFKSTFKLKGFFKYYLVDFINHVEHHVDEKIDFNQTVSIDNIKFNASNSNIEFSESKLTNQEHIAKWYLKKPPMIYHTPIGATNILIRFNGIEIEFIKTMKGNKDKILRELAIESFIHGTITAYTNADAIKKDTNANATAKAEALAELLNVLKKKLVEKHLQKDKMPSVITNGLFRIKVDAPDLAFHYKDKDKDGKITVSNTSLVGVDTNTYDNPYYIYELASFIQHNQSLVIDEIITHILAIENGLQRSLRTQKRNLLLSGINSFNYENNLSKLDRLSREIQEAHGKYTSKKRGRFKLKRKLRRWKINVNRANYATDEIRTYKSFVAWSAISIINSLDVSLPVRGSYTRSFRRDYLRRLSVGIGINALSIPLGVRGYKGEDGRELLVKWDFDKATVVDSLSPLLLSWNFAQRQVFRIRDNVKTGTLVKDIDYYTFYSFGIGLNFGSALDASSNNVFSYGFSLIPYMVKINQISLGVGIGINFSSEFKQPKPSLILPFSYSFDNVTK